MLDSVGSGKPDGPELVFGPATYPGEHGSRDQFLQFQLVFVKSASCHTGTFWDYLGSKETEYPILGLFLDCILQIKRVYFALQK